MRPRGDSETLAQPRRRGIKLLRQGYAPVEVAQQRCVERRSVRRWHAAYRKQGDSGIEARPTPGRPPALTDQDEKRLEKLLLNGAKAAGFYQDSG